MSEQSEMVNNTGYYRSLLSKPGRLFRTAKTTPSSASAEDEKLGHHNGAKPSSPPKITSNALREAAKEEVYKLSTINDSGVYLPPSPNLKSKRDNWLDINQEDLAFRLPSPECLTSRFGKNHSFYTPSATIHL